MKFNGRLQVTVTFLQVHTSCTQPGQIAGRFKIKSFTTVKGKLTIRTAK